MTPRSAAPIQKVSFAALAGFITTILVWVLKTYAGTDLPPDVAAAITGLIMFLTAYMVPMAPSDLEPVKSVDVAE